MNKTKKNYENKMLDEGAANYRGLIQYSSILNAIWIIQLSTYNNVFGFK